MGIKDNMLELFVDKCFPILYKKVSWKKEDWSFENLKYHLWVLGRGKNKSVRSSDLSEALISSTKLK